MGNLKLFILFFVSVILYGQKSIKIISVNKNDNIILKKDNRKNFLIKIPYKKNIVFNKENNLKPVVYAGGLSCCEKCKKEFDIYLIQQITKPKGGIVKNYTVSDFIKIGKNNNEYFDFENFWGNYFKIEDGYYKLINRGPID